MLTRDHETQTWVTQALTSGFSSNLRSFVDRQRLFVCWLCSNVTSIRSVINPDSLSDLVLS